MANAPLPDDCALLSECARIDQQLLAMNLDPKTIHEAAKTDPVALAHLREACARVTSVNAQGECIRNHKSGLRGVRA